MRRPRTRRMGRRLRDSVLRPKPTRPRLAVDIKGEPGCVPGKRPAHHRAIAFPPDGEGGHMD